MKQKSYKLYLKNIFFLSFSLIIIIGSINYFINPGNVYPTLNKYYNKKQSTTKFIDQLINSDNGILFDNSVWNMRDIKQALAKNNNDADCAIIGSSRIMQISSERPTKSLSKICPKITNLGIPGTSLEDYLIASKNILRNSKPPKTILIGIDPWIFILNRDKRWRRYKNDFFLMKDELEENLKISSTQNYEKVSFNIALISNLINYDYFSKSIKLILSKNNKFIEHAPVFDYKKGLDKPVLLSDGTGIYAKNYQEKSKSIKISGVYNYDIGGISKTKYDEGQWYQEKALKLFVNLINYLKEDFNIIFILTPYHPAVWEIEDQTLVKAMKNIELKTHEIANSLNVKVIGSFDPNHINCTKEEFFDPVHPKDTCLSKLEN